MYKKSHPTMELIMRVKGKLRMVSNKVSQVIFENGFIFYNNAMIFACS